MTVELQRKIAGVQVSVETDGHTKAEGLSKARKLLQARSQGSPTDLVPYTAPHGDPRKPLELDFEETHE